MTALPLPKLDRTFTADQFETMSEFDERSQSAATPPDLAIEVGSPRDWETKKRQAEARAKVPRYLDNGVQVVWIINPKKQQVEVYRNNQPVQVLEIGDTLTVEDLIPGFSLPVALLFEGD